MADPYSLFCSSTVVDVEPDCFVVGVAVTRLAVALLSTGRVLDQPVRPRSRTSSIARRRNSGVYFNGRAMTAVSFPAALKATE